MQVDLGNVPLRIPDRFKEGYGPNAPGLRRMRDEGVDLVLILDAGIVAFDALLAARDCGLDVIVLDHHEAEQELPVAHAVVNPNRKDQPPGLGHMCAAGVTFLFCIEVCRQMAKRDPAWQRPDMMPLVGLAALGTVADVVPLKGVNRGIVATGLTVLSRRQIPGIAAMANLAGIEGAGRFTARDCGFIFGPRINAGGRIGPSDLGARLLLEDEPAKASAMAQELEEMNIQRKDLEAEATAEALADPSLAERSPRDPAVTVGTGHEGVVGISASRVKDALDAPSIVLTLTEEGLLKGSARSVKGFDIGHAIIDARKAGLIEKGGGHGMAGGLTLRPDQLEPFRDYLRAQVAASDYAKTGVLLDVDFRASRESLTPEFIDALSVLEPFGTGNVEPMILVPGVVDEIFILKDKHIKMKLDIGERRPIDLLSWNCVGAPFGDALAELKGRQVEALGKLQVNEFNGRRSVQMILEDLRIP